MILGKIFIQFSLMSNPEDHYFSLFYTRFSNDCKKNKKLLLTAYSSLWALFPNVWATCVKASHRYCLCSRKSVQKTTKITKGD